MALYRKAEKPQIKAYGEGSKVFRVSQLSDYLAGHLRYGSRTGYIRAESKEDALNKLIEHDYTDYLEVNVDSYELEDSCFESFDFEITEVKEN